MKNLLCFVILMAACGIDALIDAAYQYMTWQDVTALFCVGMFGFITFTVSRANSGGR